MKSKAVDLVRASAAVAVFRSTQTWGGSDRGIQLFGRARELRGRAALDAERLYAKRFRAYEGDLPAFRTVAEIEASARAAG